MHQITKLSGGAPNNFLKLTNEKKPTPFGTTTQRFKEEDAMLTDVGPGQYTVGHFKMAGLMKGSKSSFNKTSRFTQSKS